MTAASGTVTAYDPSLAPQVARMFNDFNELWPGGFGGAIPFDEQRVRDWLDDTSALADLIAMDPTGRPVGYCGLYPHWKDPQAAYVSVLGVVPRVKGQGFGKRLLLEALETARVKAISRVDLHTWSGNMNAVPLYKKVGMFWVPETSVYMQDYVPGLLRVSLAQEWFACHPDWYTCFRRELLQAPDKQVVEGMELYAYVFAAGEDRLTAEVDRYGWGFCGFERLLAGQRVAIRTRLKSHNILMGIPNAMTLTIDNQLGQDLSVALTIEPFKGLTWSEPFPLSFSVPSGETIDVTRSFVVDKSAKPYRRDERSEVIKSRAILGGQVIDLVAGGKIQPAIQLSCQQAYQIAPVGRGTTVHLGLENHADRALRGSVSVFAEGADQSYRAMDLTLEPEELAGLAFGVHVPPDADSPVWMLHATPTIEVEGARLEMPTYRFPVVADLGNLAVVVQGDDDRHLNLLTDALDVAVELEGGRLRIGSRSLPGPRQRIGFEIGPPFGINLDETLTYEYRVVQANAYLTLVLQANSRQAPGLQIRKYVRVSPGVREVEHWVTLTNLQPSGTVMAGGRVYTGGHGGLPIDPFSSVRRTFTPVGGEIIECDPTVPMISEQMIPQESSRWQETWTAAQSMAHGNFWAWFWKPDHVQKVKVQHGSLSSLETETMPLDPGETREVFHLWYGFSLTSLPDVRNRWGQLVGHVEIPWAESTYGVQTVQPVQAQLLDGNEVRLGTVTEKTVALSFATPYPLPGQLALHLPPDWQGGFATSEGLQTVIPMPEPLPGMPALLQIGLIPPQNTGHASECMRLHFSGEFELDFELPLLSMSQERVTLEEQEIEGEPLLSVSNGALRFCVPARLGGNLIRLQDVQGRSFLYDCFPNVAPKFFIDHHIGGLEPLVFPIDAELPFAEPEEVRVEQAQEGPWMGLRALWTARNQRQLRGQGFSVAYLTLPSSPVIRIVLEHENPTPRRVRWVGALIADLALQGSNDGTVIEVPGGEQPWIRNPVPKPFLSQANLSQPWARAAKGDQSLTLLVPRGSPGMCMMFDLQVMVGGLLAAQLETEPDGSRRTEFALAVNEPRSEIEGLIVALARR